VGQGFTLAVVFVKHLPALQDTSYWLVESGLGALHAVLECDLGTLSLLWLHQIRWGRN
jgi:hypothetical protein